MFDEINYTRDLANTLEERKLLQQMVSLGVGYPYGRSWFSKAAIPNENILHRCILSMCSSQKYSDAGSITQEYQNHIRNGDNGYYLLDLQKGRILSRRQHSIEDILIDFIPRDTDDRVLLRRRKGTCFHNTGFLIEPNGVYFLWMDRTCILLKEFHMLSFVSLYGDSKSSLVVDYDATQSDRPLVLFPCEENNDIIQFQLDYDDRCLEAEYESFIRNIGYGRKNI